jgi:hypothetical protein
MSPMGPGNTLPKSAFDALPAGLGFAFGATWPVITSLLGIKDMGAFTNAISLSYMLTKYYFGKHITKRNCVSKSTHIFYS